MTTLAEQLKKVEEVLTAITAPPASAAEAPPAMIELKQDAVMPYINGELAKAKEEKDAEKAKKRLAHLQKNIVLLAKVAWESTESAKIPEYQEPNLTGKSEESMKETQPAVVMQPEASLASNESQVLGKLLTDLQKSVEGLAAAAAPPVPAVPAVNPNADFWPRDLNDPNFMKEGVAKRGGAGTTDGWGTDPWSQAPAAK